MVTSKLTRGLSSSSTGTFSIAASVVKPPTIIPKTNKKLRAIGSKDVEVKDLEAAPEVYRLFT
ncbi:hypothetical protein V2J09_009829 [Rumex salicifolius]